MGLFAPNAAGKSSLFDAISFCLYDKSSRAFKAQNIMNNRKSDFECELHFQVNGIDFFDSQIHFLFSRKGFVFFICSISSLD